MFRTLNKRKAKEKKETNLVKQPPFNGFDVFMDPFSVSKSPELFLGQPAVLAQVGLIEELFRNGTVPANRLAKRQKLFPLDVTVLGISSSIQMVEQAVAVVKILRLLVFDVGKISIASILTHIRK